MHPGFQHGLGVEAAEHRQRHVEPRHHHILAGGQRGFQFRVFGDHRVAGDVADHIPGLAVFAQILDQGGVDQAVNVRGIGGHATLARGSKAGLGSGVSVLAAAGGESSIMQSSGFLAAMRRVLGISTRGAILTMHR